VLGHFSLFNFVLNPHVWRRHLIVKNWINEDVCTGQYPFHLTLLECQGLSVVPFFAWLRHAKRQPAMALTPPQWRSVMVNMLRVYF
jgi:hypothetical protein